MCDNPESKTNKLRDQVNIAKQNGSRWIHVAIADIEPLLGRASGVDVPKGDFLGYLVLGCGKHPRNVSGAPGYDLGCLECNRQPAMAWFQGEDPRKHIAQPAAPSIIERMAKNIAILRTNAMHPCLWTDVLKEFQDEAGKQEESNAAKEERRDG